MISRLFCAILPLEFIGKITYNIFYLILFKSYNSISMIRFVSVFSLNLNGPREERRKMNYREFVYAVEKQLNQKMGGDAFLQVYIWKNILSVILMERHLIRLRRK